MAITTGTLGSSATNAAQLYTILAGLLGANAHWTLTSDSPLSAVNSGLTGTNSYVWKCDEGADFYVCIEVDDANDRIRVRAAEAYDTVAHDPNQGAGIHSTSNIAQDAANVTPTANATLFDVAKTSWGGILWYSQLHVPDAGTYYLLEVRDHLITLATRPSTQNWYCIVGQMESLVTAVPDVNPLCLFDHPINSLGSGDTLGTSSMAYGCASRSPGLGSVTTVGAFCLQINSLHYPAYINSATAPSQQDQFGGLLAGTPHKYYLGSLASQAVVHGSANNAVAARRAFRGWLPSFVVTGWDTAAAVSEPALGETFSVDGVVYYFLGACAGMQSTTVLVDGRSQILAIRAV
jgi:hypothetical protein